jgi:1-acyl-sn-glycerol-3-phosphate acyltransferase/MFS family permease
VPSARVRFLSLWLSQTLRVLADWCLRVFVFRTLYDAGPFTPVSAWPIVTAVFIAPFLILCPVNGAISNSLPKRWVLVGAAGFCFCVIVGFGLTTGSWLVGFGLMAIGAAVYSPTRYALLPAVARDTGWPLPRVNSLIELGGASAIVGGALLGFDLYGKDWPVLSGWPPAVALVAGFNLVAMIFAVPAYFPSDLRRPEPPTHALRGFFADLRRILGDQEARFGLLGLGFFLALLTVGAGVMAQFALDPSLEADKNSQLWSLFYVFLGVAIGSGLAGIQKHVYRALSLVPVAALGMLAALGWAAWTRKLEGPCILLGLMGGLLNVPLRAFYQARVPPDARGNGMACMNVSIYVGTITLSLILFLLAETQLLPGAIGQMVFLMVVTATGVVAALCLSFRCLLEQSLELLERPMYRFSAYGPGLAEFPMQGPVVVVANHTAWFDPIWIGTAVPRFVTPMMTSVYYDKPVIRWLMMHVVHTIRVPQAAFRREAPELKDAVAALDARRVLLVFPEGALKRKEEQILRYFGQGIWRILKERPQTPVVACWVEGGWGSYTSYFHGPPTVNKSPDWRRPIRLGMSAPIYMDPRVLEDQRATRVFLMRACLEARKHLGLPPGELPGRAEETNDQADDENS